MSRTRPYEPRSRRNPFVVPSARRSRARARSRSPGTLVTPPWSPQRDDAYFTGELELVGPEEQAPVLSNPSEISCWLRHVSEGRDTDGKREWRVYFESYPDPVWVSRDDLPRTPEGSLLWKRISRLGRDQEIRAYITNAQSMPR